jgi:formylglycine-generating enzyme required for sulfatase activity
MCDDDFCYDVFISCSHADEMWMQRELLPRLKKAGISHTDRSQFEPGRPQLNEIERAICESRRTLLVLTPDYLEDDWRHFESIMVGTLGLEIGKWRAIPAIAQSCGLPLRLHTLVPVNLHTGEECEWRRLISALSPHKNSTESGSKEKSYPAIETVHIPAGYCWIGSQKDDPLADDDENPQHKLFLPSYIIGKYPITNIQYQAFVNGSGHPAPSHWTDNYAPPDRETHPVVNVSYEDAVAFCQWLSKAADRYYRLPTEEEWEKAARGQDKRRFPWGDEWTIEFCNTREAGLDGTTPVEAYAQRGTSPYGVEDLSGNVAEWTCSWYGRYRDSVDQSQHYGRMHRVVRGGGWINSAGWARTSFRGHYEPDTRRSYVGFRVALTEL